jgi:ATP-dependent helicase/nuclease subunit A
MSVTSNLQLPFDEIPSPPKPHDADELARVFAVDPRRNVVLEASAGTGKTRVLVERYVNLLRSGVDPANILAITFTRKAAADMRQRILARLKEAATQSDVDGARWRDLRERAGEIAIGTIDAFCLSLLREFPLEADLEPGFAMADETETPRYVQQALDNALRIFRGVAREQEAIALVFAQIPENRIRQGLEALLNRRLVAPQALARFLERGPRELTAAQAVRVGIARLKLSLESVEGGLDAFLTSGPGGHRRYEILRQDVLRLVDNKARVEVADAGWVRAGLYRVRQHFFNKDGKPRKQLTPHYLKSHFTSDRDYRHHLACVNSLAPRLDEDIRAFQRDLNVVLSRGVWQMFQIAKKEYDKTLEAHAALDFSEVLERAVRLLQQMDEFARSRYRLESRYHHVLVDEFQDTSRAQWNLVSLLVKSWGEGFGLVDNAPLRPSVFIVGDRKQSIYGFRDAEVTVLQDAREYIAALRPEEPARQSIARSARATPALLRFVNDVFEDVERADRDDAFTYTEADRFPTPPSDGSENVDPPLGLVAAEAIEACANGVALEIEWLVATGDVRDRETGLARKVRHADIAILFRSRESHREFEKALEDCRIPTYVYKGLGFFDADEVKDVVALLRYLANPESHLRAAAFLRSRFIRVSDSALRLLTADLAGALGDSEPSAALETLDAEDQRVLMLARDGVQRWRALADRLPPAELLDLVLAETAYAFELRGSRLVQARENLKKIRAIVRRVQNRGYSTLARLADYLDRMSAGDEANAIIDAADAVNLMTVHAAKGLEFPIVFVVNLSRGAGGIRPPIRVLTDDGAGEPSVSVGEFESEADEDLRARDREESKRLLYVALTRARDRLYLSSVIKDGVWRPGGGGLGEVLPPALGALLVQASSSTANASLVWTQKSGAQHVLRRCPSPATLADISDEGRADRLRVPLVNPPIAVDRFAPLEDIESARWSSVTGVVAGQAGLRPAQAAARDQALSADVARTLKGRLVHRLLQHCGDHDALDQTVEALAHALVRRDERLGVEDVAGTVAEAIRAFKIIRGHEEFSARRLEDCLFEVPFSFRVQGDTTVLRGTVDCLARAADGSLTIFEFKTGRPSPDHRAQLDVYVAAVRALFPEAAVEGRLIYS